MGDMCVWGWRGAWVYVIVEFVGGCVRMGYGCLGGGGCVCVGWRI